jgi:hypothetical protein
MGPNSGTGIPGFFIAIVVIFGIVSVGIGIWRFSVLRSAGLNPFVAKEQVEARVYQSDMFVPNTSAAPTAPAGQETLEQRLMQLQDLHYRGVISDEELTAARAKAISGD